MEVDLGDQGGKGGSEQGQGQQAPRHHPLPGAQNPMKRALQVPARASGGARHGETGAH